MWKPLCVLAVIACAFFVTPCLGKSKKPPPTKVNTRCALDRLSKACIKLSGEFVYQLLNKNPNSNCLSSATSVLLPMAQLAYFATGRVSEQLLKLLNLKSQEEIKHTIPRFLNGFKNQTNVILDVGDKYYFNMKYPLSNSFKKDSSEIFSAKGQNIDFGNRVEAAKIINDWVKKHTHNKITNLVNPSMFSESTRLVLANAIYYTGKWLYRFDSKSTKEEDFHINKTHTVQLPIMHQEEHFQYYQDDDMQIQALEIPFQNRNFSFLIILPRDQGVDAVKAVANKLRDPKVYTGILDKMRMEKVYLHLPRMQISTTIDVAEMLKNDKVTAVFDPSNDLNKILKNPEPLSITDAIQKAYMLLNENGATLAAATATGVGAEAAIYPPPKTYEFNVNRPCMFYLIQNKTPLFGGSFLGSK